MAEAVKLEFDEGKDAMPPVAGTASSEKSPADAGLLESITFGYGLPMMRVGASRPLKASDLPPIRAIDHASTVTQRIRDAWMEELAQHPTEPSLWRALFWAFRWKTFLCALYTLLESVTRVAQPVILGSFLRALEEDWVESLYLCAGGLVVASLLQAVVHHQLFFTTMTLGWNLRVGIVGTLHWKLLRLRASWVQSSSADCYNLVANDCQRFELAMPFLHFGWCAFADLIAVGALLVLEVGWLPSLAGLAVVLIFASVMIFFGSRLASRRRITAGITDGRLKLTSQVFEAIMSVKIYCWEDALIKRIAELRSHEHHSIFQRQVMIASIGAMYYSLAPIACLALFLTFLGLQGGLSVPAAYTALSLLQVLRVSFGKGFAKAVETVPECHAAVGRLASFLAQPEAPSRKPLPLTNSQDLALEVSCASFAWPSGGTQALRSISCRLRRGELLVVSGPVGCGKSALLQALLGELELTSGGFELRGTAAYAPQAPWIVSGTLRSNILLGEPLDTQRYEQAIDACGLRADLLQLGPLGDLTEIGERGVNLSGGQRARVGLARAVYARPDLALLDDPLAAVDPAVAAHLVRECLRGEALRSAAVVLCTHHESVFALADTLLLLGEGGAVRACGPPRQVASECGFSLSTSPKAKASIPEPEPAAKDSGRDGVQEASKKSLIKAEDKAQGSVTLNTYLRYVRLAGIGVTVLVLGMFLLSQVVLLYSNYWLGLWSDAEDQSSEHYGLVFIILTAVTVLCACLRSVLFYFGSLRAASSLHRSALQRVLSTHLGFFTANPQGRIMNRFSADLGSVDELLSQSLHEVLDLGFLGAGAVLTVCITVPPGIPVFLAMFYYMIRLRRFTVKSMTELKRLDSLSRSPVFDCFAASLRGIACLRAFGREKAVQDHMVALLEANGKAWFWWLITNRFIGFRLDFQCVFIMALAAFGGAALRDVMSKELVGLAIVQAILLSGLFQFMVRQSALVESFMTSFERLQSYAELPGEASASAGQRRPPPGFPAEGSVEVAGLHMRYREDLPEVLKGVDFHCPAGAKVGICGRTGSGKSSLFMALSRLADVTQGSVRVGGEDAAKLPLAELRGCMAWVPQEPSFFSGSLRFNLDPLGTHSEDDLWTSLRSVQMAEAVGDQGLDAAVAEGGSNFSVGERQLLSLARALLQRRRILCMDEAFANVDFATDSKVQAAIRVLTKEVKATVLVIAHRLRTLADSDYIVVMDEGRCVEQGPPAELLRAGGAYARLAHGGESYAGARQPACLGGLLGALSLAQAAVRSPCGAA